MRVADRRCLVKQGMDVARDTGHQRHLDKDQRLVGHARVKEREAAAIGLQPAAQVVPAVDLVHRLVADDLLQQLRR